MDAAALGVLDGLAAAIDVLQRGARQAADHGVLGALGDLAHGLEIAVGGEGVAGLDDVDAHVVEQFGDLELFLEGHGGAGALLAVAQGGVKNVDAVLVGLGGGGHEVLWSVVAAEGRSGSGDLVKPLSAQANAPRRPSGAAKKQKPGKNAARGARIGDRGRGGRPLLSAYSPANHLCLSRSAGNLDQNR